MVICYIAVHLARRFIFGCSPSLLVGTVHLLSLHLFRQFVVSSLARSLPPCLVVFSIDCLLVGDFVFHLGSPLHRWGGVYPFSRLVLACPLGVRPDVFSYTHIGGVLILVVLHPPWFIFGGFLHYGDFTTSW